MNAFSFMSRQMTSLSGSARGMLAVISSWHEDDCRADAGDADASYYGGSGQHP